MTYDVIIGIETHIQLKTLTKMFCSCSAQTWRAEPNTHTCPVCLGLPGALPVINKAALEAAMLVGLALEAKVVEKSHFDRKNYFYPDLAKGYQISQYDQPFNVGGSIEVDGKRIGIIRAHLEEDVAKMTHLDDRSLIDFNKGGTPLLEIVSEPVMHSAAEAKAYVQALHQLVRYLGVNDGNLEQGSMRADLNISLQAPDKYRYVDGKFEVDDGYQMNNRVEIKNVNSFRAIERAIDYEIKRQAEALDQGESIVQETRGWDDVKGVTTEQRSKEEAHDYRYFPEPDLPPLEISRDWVSEIQSRLPELPQAKRVRFIEQYGLSEYDARLLVVERINADWFEEVVAASGNRQAEREKDSRHAETSSASTVDGSGILKHRLRPVQDDDDRQSTSDNGELAKVVANWMLGELARLQNDRQTLIAESQLLPAQLAVVIRLVQEQKLSAANAKEIVAEAFVSGKDPLELIKELGLEQVSDSGELEVIGQTIIDQNQDVVEKYKAGKESSLMFLVGQVMKETKGRGNPAVVKEVLEKLLK